MDENLTEAVAVSTEKLADCGPGEWWCVVHPDGYFIEIGCRRLRAEQLAAEINAGLRALSEKQAREKAVTETGWLIELKGSTPSWATVNPNDCDDHWTTDSTKAIRFARQADAQACIDWIGWTKAFPSEHIWDDGRASPAPALVTDLTAAPVAWIVIDEDGNTLDFEKLAPMLALPAGGHNLYAHPPAAGATIAKLTRERDEAKAEAKDQWLRFEEADGQRFAAQSQLASLRAVLANRISAEHEFLLVEALAEIKATVDGESDQPVRDIIYGLLAEIEALPKPARAALNLNGGTDV